MLQILEKLWKLLVNLVEGVVDGLSRFWARLVKTIRGVMNALGKSREKLVQKGRAIRSAIGNFWGYWGQRTQLFSYLLLGTVFAVGHHLMCRHFDGKRVHGTGAAFGGEEVDQTLVSAGSNALALLVKYSFAAAIGVTYAQCFWRVVKPFSNRVGVQAESAVASRWSKNELEVINAPVAAAQGNPFLPSSFKTWLSSPSLASISLVMLLLFLIPTFAPGSIGVVTPDFSVPISCNIPTPNITLVGVDNLDLTAIFNNVAFSGSYLPIQSPCGVCAYNVTFLGPSLKCSPDLDYDFAALQLHDGQLPLYVGRFNPTPFLIITAATQDGNPGAPNPPRAIRCEAYSTLYRVQVRHNATARVDILDATDVEPLSTVPLSANLLLLTTQIGFQLVGEVFYSIDFKRTLSTVPVVTRLLHRSQDINTKGTTFNWDNMEEALPSLMRNMSISLLSGQYTPWNGSYLDAIPGTCMSASPVYEYQGWRLLMIYGIGWAVAVGSLALGFVLISKNGRERTMDFSKLVSGLGPRTIQEETEP
ncbi:hypothetical protein DFP72DRAFT_1174017 [Ephemerocybe angulata]|uniref:Uncharacterized protein n=1 Tax=Ephemerocybe angulata TaxID=980116 RepID=A0A8H6HLV6_9AGAR|nr:hypothetical protein DFP72DRAFT_1174017 [Tulosesus angulatus]